MTGRVIQQLTDDLRQVDSIAPHTQRRGRHAHRDLLLKAFRQRTHHCERVTYDFGDQHGLDTQRPLAFVDPRDFEEVVHPPEQLTCHALDGPVLYP
jgi:hypothetical protein